MEKLSKFLAENEIYMFAFKHPNLDYVCEWGLPGRFNRKFCNSYNEAMRYGLKRVKVLLKQVK